MRRIFVAWYRFASRGSGLEPGYPSPASRSNKCFAHLAISSLGKAQERQWAAAKSCALSIRGHREREELKMAHLQEFKATFTDILPIEKEATGLSDGLLVTDIKA